MLERLCEFYGLSRVYYLHKNIGNLSIVSKMFKVKSVQDYQHTKHPILV